MCLRKWFLPEDTEERNKENEGEDSDRNGLCSHQGSGWIAFVVRGGADVKGGQTSSTEVEQWRAHTLAHRAYTHTRSHQEAQQWKGVGLCRRGPLSFSLGVQTTYSEGKTLMCPGRP